MDSKIHARFLTQHRAEVYHFWPNKSFIKELAIFSFVYLYRFIIVKDFRKIARVDFDNKAYKLLELIWSKGVLFCSH